MADNIAVTPGVGVDIGGDLISTVLYQRVKLIHGIDGVNDGDVALTNPLPVSVSGGTITVNTISTTTVTQPIAAELNCVVSNGTITVNTVSTVGITGTVSTTNLTASNFNVVVSNGTIMVNTISTIGIVGTVGCVSLNAADFNVVVSSGTITVNTISSIAITGTVSTTEASAASMLTALQIMDDWDDADKAKVVIPLRTTKFQGSLNASVATTAVTVVDGAATNANLHITSYLISASAAGTYWLEDGAGTALTPYHYLAANGGASFTSSISEPISTGITATTIKLKASGAGSIGCLVLGYSA